MERVERKQKSIPIEIKPSESILNNNIIKTIAYSLIASISVLSISFLYF